VRGEVTWGILLGTLLTDILARDLGKGLSRESRRLAGNAKTVRIVERRCD